MLVSFKVGNFLSFNEDQEFSMIAMKSDEHSNHLIESDGFRLLRLSAIYGPNSSGKSNLIKALNYSKEVVAFPEISHQREKGLLGNLSHRDCRGNYNEGPSHFQYTLKFDGDEGLYVYGFDYDTRNSLFVSEWLVYIIDESENIIFNLDYNDLDNSVVSEQCFADYFDSLKDKDKIFDRSFLLAFSDFECNDKEVQSLADMLFSILLELITIEVHTSVDEDFHIPFTMGMLNSLIKDLNRFDTGITGYRLTPVIPTYHSDIPYSFVRDAVSPDMTLQRTFNPFLENSSNHMANISLKLVFTSGSLFISSNPKSSSTNSMDAEVQFLHSLGLNPIPYSEESEGTKRLIRLLCILYTSKEKGGVVFIDELECNIHALAVQKFIDYFISDHGFDKTQLIISTHDSRLLDYHILRRDEIWFIELNNDKDDKYSSLFSLSSFVDDVGSNIDLAYLEGRFGAIPIFTDVFQEDRRC